MVKVKLRVVKAKVRVVILKLRVVKLKLRVVKELEGRGGRNSIGTVTLSRNQTITGFPGIGFISRNNSDTEKKL